MIKNSAWQRMREGLKWLYPGIGIKRWGLLLVFGIVIVILGALDLNKTQPLFLKILDLLLIILGILLLLIGIVRLIHAFFIFFYPEALEKKGFADNIYRRRRLERGPNVVAIGGGTGLSVLLKGLREYTFNISAIVTVADDGGSSGRLRQQFDILPPGDIRNCLVALADAPALMSQLFQFRFDKFSEFSGHSFGNLFITVMTKITGDFDKAVKESSKVLAIRGQVIPSTLNKVMLSAGYKDGSIVKGETNIPKAGKPIASVWLDPKNSKANQEALLAIKQAEMIILGPGSLYTSIIPNLLVKDITEAIVASSAPRVYICNVMTQLGETDNFSASDHLKALIEHTNPNIVDYCLFNTGDIPQEIKERYAKEGSLLVPTDTSKFNSLGYHYIGEDVVGVFDGCVRHDHSKLVHALIGLLEEI